MKRWTVNGVPSPAQIEEIAALLASGGVVLMPTDTIYGLHAVYGSDAVRRVAQMKGRDESKHFVTIAASADQARTLGGVDLPDILASIWPAPMTAILARDTETIAVRVPNLDWLRSLLERTGPLISTSANRSGEPSITTPNELAQHLQNALDGIVDAGPCEGKASAIVDFTGERPRVVREGDSRFTQFLRKTLRKTL